jgi:hopene-associated glycosyltransferase HpnB
VNLRWWDLVGWAVAGAWVYLLVGRGCFWRTVIRLGDAPAPSRWPAVAVVVPARDEAEMLAITVPFLAAQDYPGLASVVVVDDNSTDQTAATALAAGAGGRLPVDVIGSGPRPEGWMGKLWALHQGIDHASGRSARPDWLLLTDADIAHPPDSLRRLVAAAIAERRDAVSLRARLRVVTRWERLIIPAFVYFFAQLYPFGRVGRVGRVGRSGRTAAAAGGCVLVRRSALERAGGIAAVHDAVIDDVALARRLQGTGSSIWLGLADDVTSVRPYPRLADLWNMVARSAFTQLRHSGVLLAGTVIGLTAIYLGPLVALAAGWAAGDWWLAGAGLVASVIMTATYAPTVRYYRLPSVWALTLPIAAAMYAAMTVDSARRHWRGDGVEWKGRRYQTPRPVPRV